MEEHFFFLVFSIFFLFSFSFPFSSTWKPDLLCSTLLLHAHTSSIFSASSIPLPQRVSTTRHCHSCSFVVHALDLWLSAPPHVGSAYMVGLLFFFLFFFFFFFFLAMVIFKNGCKWFCGVIRTPGSCLLPMNLIRPLSIPFLLMRFSFRCATVVDS